MACITSLASLTALSPLPRSPMASAALPRLWLKVRVRPSRVKLSWVLVVTLSWLARMLTSLSAVRRAYSKEGGKEEDEEI
jgi:hypothetical protein